MRGGERKRERRRERKGDRERAEGRREKRELLFIEACSFFPREKRGPTATDDND